MKDEKAISPVVGIMLMIAITIVLGVTLIFFATAFEMQEPAPFVAHSSGELVRKGGADVQKTDQRVYLYHEGGDPIDVSDIEIVVSFDKNDKVGTLHNFPIEGDDPNPTSEYVSGDDVFDNSHNSIEGSIGTGDVDDDGMWSTGEYVMFRISNTAVSLNSGDIVYVKIIHTPTNTVIMEETLTAS
ncbi:type IV pilin [Methanohalophilus sp. RSK]|uniref:type IV pilin n=1 Tax=Methanohalophilus sp. RSK TaxID=2485783 RepID=UPI0013146432|nr:type IV pilin [Methanohalophilus sp. RSK]